MLYKEAIKDFSIKNWDCLYDILKYIHSNVNIHDNDPYLLQGDNYLAYRLAGDNLLLDRRFDKSLKISEKGEVIITAIYTQKNKITTLLKSITDYENYINVLIAAKYP